MVERKFETILMEFLKAEKLTQTAFAVRIGAKQSQVSEWLSGKAKPGYDMLKRISVSFDISSDYLLGLKDYY